MKNKTLNTKEISELLGVSRRTAQRLVNDYLKANKIICRYVNKEQFLKFYNLKI